MSAWEPCLGASDEWFTPSYIFDALGEIFYGEWPSDELDHINRDRRDNRVANLRLANRSINCRNQTLTPTETGVVGVNKRRGRKRWHAHISDGHQRKSLGYFDNLSDAIAARKAAETRLGYDEYRGAEE